MQSLVGKGNFYLTKHLMTESVECVIFSNVLVFETNWLRVWFLVKIIPVFLFLLCGIYIFKMCLLRFKFMANQLLQERLVVNTLQFNMSVPTPYVFMRRFLKAAQSDKKVYKTIQRLLYRIYGCNLPSNSLHLVWTAWTPLILLDRTLPGWVWDAQVPAFFISRCSSLHSSVYNFQDQRVEQDLRILLHLLWGATFVSTRASVDISLH